MRLPAARPDCGKLLAARYLREKSVICNPWAAKAKAKNGGGVVKQTSQRSLLFRQNVNRTEAEWVHFLDGYRKALIEFDMKKFGDDWHTAEDIVEEIFLNIVREPRITVLRPQDSFRHVLINMCMQKHKSFTKPWRRRLAERLSVALCLTMRKLWGGTPLTIVILGWKTNDLARYHKRTMAIAV